jgi:hypothetical protein
MDMDSHISRREAQNKVVRQIRLRSSLCAVTSSRTQSRPKDVVAGQDLDSGMGLVIRVPAESAFAVVEMVVVVRRNESSFEERLFRDAEYLVHVDGCG